MEEILMVTNENGVEIEAPVVGTYGTFDEPVVLVEGKEVVATLYYTDADGNKVAPVCLSSGCDRCQNSCAGCRLANEGYQSNYFI